MSAQREALLEVAAVQLRAARADIDAALALIGVAREDDEPKAKQQAPNPDDGYVNVFGGRMRVGDDDTPANGQHRSDLKPMTRRMLDDLQQQQTAATGEPDGTTSPNNGAP